MYLKKPGKMSCNGCRVLRKGCNDNCILRQSLQAIDTPQAQSNATVFVAKFFGRAGLVSFLSAVPQSQRPALFQSLLFEACGRTINPVGGAVGLLSTGNWRVCQSAVETVLRGGVLRALPEFSPLKRSPEIDEANDEDLYGSRDLKRNRFEIDREAKCLNLGTASCSPARGRRREKRRPASPSDEFETTTFESEVMCQSDLQQSYNGDERKLLRLFF